MKDNSPGRSSGTKPGAANSFGVREKFRFCAQWVAGAVGSPQAFLLACATIVIWGATGPLFHYSDTWQLVINTATTIVTFLIVFLIQNTQNRETRAIQLKLDELLRGLRGARNSLVDLEALSDEELERLHKEFERLRTRASTLNVAPPQNPGQAGEG